MTVYTNGNGCFHCSIYRQIFVHRYSKKIEHNVVVKAINKPSEKDNHIKYKSLESQLSFSI